MKGPRRNRKKPARPPTLDVARTQALLRENQVLLDNAFVGIFFVRDRRFIRTNRRAETLFGYAPDELIGRSTEVIYPDHATFLALGERAYPIINRGEVFADEVELARRDGGRFWCQMRAQALAPGQPLEGIIWMLDDITERKYEAQIRHPRGELRSVVFHKATLHHPDGSLRGLIGFILDETLPRELDRVRRLGEPLAVAMLDLDHCKRFNDTFGHKTGDAVLQALGTLLGRTLRSSDLACRYGGEEFTLILPGSTLAACRTLGDFRIRRYQESSSVGARLRAT